MKSLRILCLVTAIAAIFMTAEGHGFLLDPPARGSIWRTKIQGGVKNNDDMALSCGGIEVQHEQNGGKCGACGDDFSGVKENEPGPENRYAQGVITAKYTAGQMADIVVQITAFHKGYFEFRICKNDRPQMGKDASVAVRQSCFDRYLLKNSTGGTTFEAKRSKAAYRMQIPSGINCKACALQWTYTAGNNWGCDEHDKTLCGLGFGNQETFRNCADVEISSGGSRKTSNDYRATRRRADTAARG